MKKLIAFIFLSLFSTAAFSDAVWNFSSANSKLNAATNPMIVIVGDSNVARWKVTSFPGYQAVKWGENGVNSRDVLVGVAQVKWSKRPAICTLMIGTNDAYGRNHSQEIPVSDYKPNVIATLVLLKAHCDRVILFSQLPTRDRVNVTAYQNAAHDAAAEMNIQFIMLTEGMFPPSAFRDDVHLSTSGYVILYAAYGNAITNP